MKELLLMRHAKSDWNEPHKSDFDRPLNKRGLKAAPKIGIEFKNRKLIPDIIIASPAKRAKTTAELVKLHSGYDKEIIQNENFYFSDRYSVFKTISELDKQNNRVLIVGHNPIIENLVTHLCKEPQFLALPTASVVYITFDIQNWQDLAWGNGDFQWIIKPKELD